MSGIGSGGDSGSGSGGGSGTSVGPCTAAGFIGCCVDDCDVSIPIPPFSCYCDVFCYSVNDCCEDIASIGCFEPIGKEV